MTSSWEAGLEDATNQHMVIAVLEFMAKKLEIYLSGSKIQNS